MVFSFCLFLVSLEAVISLIVYCFHWVTIFIKTFEKNNKNNNKELMILVRLYNDMVSRNSIANNIIMNSVFLTTHYSNVTLQQ